jgi:hypothetical protein
MNADGNSLVGAIPKSRPEDPYARRSMDMNMNYSSQKPITGMGNPEACVTQSPKDTVDLRGGAGDNGAAQREEEEPGPGKRCCIGCLECCIDCSS